MNSDQTKKEIFLLEHGFYDEEVADYVNKNLGRFFSEKSINYLSGVTLETGDSGDYMFFIRKRVPPENFTVAIPSDDMQKITSEHHNLLNRARREYFKSQHPEEFKKPDEPKRKQSLIYCAQCHDFKDFTYNNNEHYNCKTCGTLLGFDRRTAERVANGKPIMCAVVRGVITSDAFCFQWSQNAEYIQPSPTKEVE
jgi:hypothetical protein